MVQGTDDWNFGTVTDSGGVFDLSKSMPRCFDLKATCYVTFVVLLLRYTVLPCVQNRQAEMMLSLQRRTKEKVVSDFSTLSKGSSVGAKPKAALRQVLFSQSQVSEKSTASEVLSRLLRRTNLL